MTSKIRKIFNLIIIILILLSTTSQAASTTRQSTLMDIVRDIVSQWYFILRYFSIVLMLVVLIYLGIKVAISSIAEEKAKYKRMLVDWVVGFIIIFIIHYYMILILTLNDKCVSLVKQASANLAERFVTGEEAALGLNPTTQGLYEMVRTRAYELRLVIGTSGMIMYMVLVYYTIKFVFIYFKRFFTILILTILAPLMGLFYAFNKIMSGKAATFKKWASEYAFNVFLQTIHAMAYGIFVTLAIGLSSQSIAGFVLAMVMLNFMGNAEKTMRKIFKLSGGLVDDNANKGIKENLAAATAMRASMGTVFGSKVAKDIGQGVRNATGFVGDKVGRVALGILNAGVDDEKLEQAEKELEEEMKKKVEDQSAEKMKKLKETIDEISELKSTVQKYRGGITDPEKLQAKIENKIKLEENKRKEQMDKEAAEARKEGIYYDRKTREQEIIREREEQLRKENDRKIIKRDKYKNVITGEKEFVSIGKVLKKEINRAVWLNDDAKSEAQDLANRTISGITGAFMTMASIPMIVAEPVAGLALLAKGRANSKKLFSNNEYRKATNLSERNAIRAGQRKIRKRQREEKKLEKKINTTKKQRKVLRKPARQEEKETRLSFNRFSAASLDTVVTQMKMDSKLNAIRKINSLSLGSLVLTAPFRLTGTLGGLKTIKSKAYKIHEARKDYYENIETFATLEKKDSINQDFILDYNIKLEGIRKTIDAKSDGEIIEKFNEDSGKIITVGNTKIKFGNDIKPPSSPEEIKTQIIDNVLLKVAAKNKVLDIKDLNLKSNKIQTQLAEEFRKVGVLNETIIPEEYEIDKTLKLNLDKLEDRIQTISKENPKAVEETIAKEVIADYIENNNIEDVNEIKKEEHREKIKLEILEIIEESEQERSFEREQPKTETKIDFSSIVFNTVESFEKEDKDKFLETQDLDETQEFEKVNEFFEPKFNPEKIDKKEKVSARVESFENEVRSEKIESLDETENFESDNIAKIIKQIKSETKPEELKYNLENDNKEQKEDVKLYDKDFMIGRLESTIQLQNKNEKKEKRLDLFENLINGIQKAETSKTFEIDDLLKNKIVAQERKRQIGIEKDKIDDQLEGFEKILDEDENLEDIGAIEDYIENKTSPEIDDLLTHLLALKEQDMAGIALKFKPESYEQKRMSSIDAERINSTYKRKI